MHEMKQLSKKNEHYLSSKRYLELKNFCLQYDEWKEELRSLSLIPSSESLGIQSQQTDRIFLQVEQRLWFDNRIKLVEESILQLDEFIRPYIFEAVTTGKSYDVINAYDQIPCCKQIYYQYYREFFSTLDHSQKLHTI